MNNYQYQVGGSLAINAVSYVKRKADCELYQHLLQGDCCYILNSRQMGKSSLLVQTFYRLQQEGYHCAIIDLTVIGSEQITPLQWYKGIVAQIYSELGLTDILRLKSWWNQQKDFSYLQILSKFIDKLLLVDFPTEKLFIFIDEIDTILSLNFSVDDFFALIRYCHERRSINPHYQRITFAISGVATPSDLIRDKNRTPFNIGRAIALDKFNYKEVKPLLAGLKSSFGNLDRAVPRLRQDRIMKAIIDWTGGQPFLTQKLCNLIVSNDQNGLRIFENSEISYVDNLVITKIINNWESQDEPEHFRTIRDRLLSIENLRGRLLGIYQIILTGELIKTDDSREQIELFLSGLVVKEQGYLKVKNAIYQAIFNLEWVEIQLEKLRPYSQTFQAWIASQQSDKSRLLKGQALQNALIWSQGKSLSDLDYQFLAASQEIDRQEMQLILESEKAQEIEARLIEEKNRRIQEQKNARLQRLLLGAVSVALAVSSILGLTAFRQYRQAIQNEIKALASSSEALFVSNQTLDALIEAIKAKRKLSYLGKNTRSNLESQVKQVLQQSVYQVREYNRLSGHDSTVNAIAFSPDGKLIVSGGGDSTLKIWQPDGKELQTFAGHKAAIWAIAIASDGQSIATAGGDNTVKLWSLDGTELQTFKGHQATVWDVAFSPDNKFIVSASGDNTIKLWSRDGKELATLRGHQKEVYSVAFSPDGRSIISGSNDNTVKLWSWDGKEAKIIQTLQGHSDHAVPAHADRVYGVAFSPDAQTIASASWDKTIKLWKFEPKSQSYQEYKTLEGHTDAVNRVVFSPDGKSIASTSWDTTVKLWQLDGTLLTTLRGSKDIVHGVAFSPDGKSIASTSWNETIRLWQLDRSLLQTLEGHQGVIYQVRFSPDGKTIATVSRDNKVKLWHKTGKLLSTLTEHQDIVFGVDFSPDGKLMATGGWDSKINIWQPRAGNWQQTKLVQTLVGHSDRVFTVAFSPDGKMLASASGDNTIKIWQIKQNSDIKLLHTLTEHQDEVYGVAFSPDSQTIASGSLDGTVKLWRTDGTFLRTLKSHKNAVIAVTFSPDGQLIASASLDGTVKLWQPKGTFLQTLAGDRNGVFDVAFSPDSRMIASSGLDNLIKVWQYQGTKVNPEAIVLNAHQGGVMGIDFSPDGKTLSSSSQDRSVILWDLNKILQLNEMTFACDWVKDYLQTNTEIEDSDRTLCDDLKK